MCLNSIKQQYYRTLVVDFDCNFQVQSLLKMGEEDLTTNVTVSVIFYYTVGDTDFCAVGAILPHAFMFIMSTLCKFKKAHIKTMNEDWA